MTAARRWRRVRVIWNAQAGQKGGIPTNRATRDELVALLESHGLAHEICDSSSPDDAAALATEAVGAGCDLVVAAGGDGTVGTVASQLLRTDTALGVLPLGSIMNIARSLGVPRELPAAVEILRSGEVRKIDVGQANERPFYETGSVGMNAAIFREAQRFEEGDWPSILKAVWVAFRYRPARMLIRLDDRTVGTRALMVTVSNGPYTGAGMTVAPGARLDDGKFDVRIFRRFSKLQLLRHLASIAFGRRRYAPEIATYRSKRVRVESTHALPCRADSEDLGMTPVEFATLPGALRVVVPIPEDRAPGAALPTDRLTRPGPRGIAPGAMPLTAYEAAPKSSYAENGIAGQGGRSGLDQAGAACAVPSAAEASRAGRSMNHSRNSVQRPAPSKRQT